MVSNIFPQSLKAFSAENPVVNFTNNAQAAFCQFPFHKNIKAQTVSTQKLV